MSVTVLVPKPVTTARVLKSLEAPGRRVGSLAGTWNADRVALRKAIILCDFCAHKFNPRRVNYERWRPCTSIAKCDDCRRMSPHAVVFIHESLHELSGDFTRRPTRGRWSLPALWGRIPWWTSR